jgi:hypothetical protein
MSRSSHICCNFGGDSRAERSAFFFPNDEPSDKLARTWCIRTSPGITEMIKDANKVAVLILGRNLKDWTKQSIGCSLAEQVEVPVSASPSWNFHFWKIYQFFLIGNTDNSRSNHWISIKITFSEPEKNLHSETNGLMTCSPKKQNVSHFSPKKWIFMSDKSRSKTKSSTFFHFIHSTD